MQLMEAEDERGDCDWSGLPNHLLEMVMDRLALSADYTRFASVCTSWRQVFEENGNGFRPPRQLPMLIIPNVVDEENLDEKDSRRKMMKNKRSLYNLSNRRVCNSFMVSIPDSVYCFGSDYGWLVTVEMKDKDYTVTLVNPFLPTNNEITLPSLHASPILNDIQADFIDRFDYAIKFVLSANPTTTNDFTVMAIGGGYRKLMMWRPKCNMWTFVGSLVDKTRNNLAIFGLFMDLIYTNGHFYALNQRGKVVVCDIVDPKNMKVELFARAPIGGRLATSGSHYIVESSGEFFQLYRELDFYYVNGDLEKDNDGHYLTHNFQVFKLLECDGSKAEERKWVEVNTLDGHAFFVGHGTSFSIVASDFPGCKPNCIYFTDDKSLMFIMRGEILSNLGPHDIGVFNIEDRSVERHYNPPESIRHHIWPNPIWIEPTVYQKSINQ